MRKIRIIFSILVVLSVLASCLSLSGCGGDTNTISKDFSLDDEELADTAYNGIEKYAGSTIRFATWIDHLQGEGAVPMASFAEKFDINVMLTPVPISEYITKVSGLIGAGQSPDMIVDNNNFPSVFVLTQPLNDVSSVNLEDDFWDDAVVEMGTVNGKSYFVNSLKSPWTYRFICFYNKKIFEDNGFKTPEEFYKENNWTIETFEECASRVSKLGDEYIGASVRPEFATGIWETSTIHFEKGKFVSGLDDGSLATAYKWMLSGKERGLFSNVTELTNFKANLCGMFLYGDFGLRTTGGMEGMDPKNIDFVPMPKVSKEDEFYPSTGTWRAYGICKGSKNAEATGYFLRWFLDFDNYDRETMFISEDASKFYDELREMEDHCKLLYPAGYEGNSTIAGGTSAQVEGLLKSIKNQVDSRIEKDNLAISKVK